jgi:RNA polymerase sigma-70 factor, ECF subfamily
MVAVERDAVVTDERLAMLAAAGDAPAFQALAERYAQAAFVYAFHYLGGYDDAHDAVQETLIQVYQVLPRARQDLPFRPWFFRILRNKCLDALRRRKPLLRLPSWDGNAGEDETAERFPDPAPLPEELYEREDLQRVLHEVIGELRPTYRDVVLLRYATEATCSATPGCAMDRHRRRHGALCHPPSARGTTRRGATGSCAAPSRRAGSLR